MCILSEHWGRKKHLKEALRSQHYKVIEYSRASSRVPYKCKKGKAAKINPTGGGCAIIYDEKNFDVTELNVDIPEGVEATWAIQTPKVNEIMKYNKILVGAIYIAPRTEYKPEAVSHIIETMQCMQAK